jgi:hypothetical protein
MTALSTKKPIAAAVAGFLLFGAGGLLALVRAPVSGGVGICLGLAAGGAVTMAIVRAHLEGKGPSTLTKGAFLTYFLASLLLLVPLPSFGLGNLCGFFLACSLGLLIRNRGE